MNNNKNDSIKLAEFLIESYKDPKKRREVVEWSKKIGLHGFVENMERKEYLSEFKSYLSQ